MTRLISVAACVPPEEMSEERLKIASRRWRVVADEAFEAVESAKQRLENALTRWHAITDELDRREASGPLNPHH